jgi:hypothetical protein
VILLGLIRNLAQRFCFSRLSQKVETGVDRVFEHLPLQITNDANHENCVPQQDEQLLYWLIFKCLSENLRTRQKSQRGSKVKVHLGPQVDFGELNDKVIK